MSAPLDSQAQSPRAAELAGMELVTKLREDELLSISTHVRDGLQAQILKSLDERGRAQELIRQQYTGRYPFELLQNASDASSDLNPAQVVFMLTDTALIVADQGTGFGSDQIRAICRLGRSSKDPRKSIGYKGLGFKSVGEITDSPQIYSASVAFGFNADRVRESVASLVGDMASDQRLPTYAFPFPINSHDLESDAGAVQDLKASGFTTVLRLPFRQGVDRAVVQGHIKRAIVPRLLLFLPSIASLRLEGSSGDFEAVALREGTGSPAEVLLQFSGQLEHWLIYRKLLVPTSDLVTPLGDAWQQVEQVQAAVGVPIGKDGLPIGGTSESLHVYFPTEEVTGWSLILQGDFSLELDRRHVGRSAEQTPYNARLAAELADFVGNVAEDLVSRFDNSPRVVAAFSPAGEASGFGLELLELCRNRLRNTKFVPLAMGGATVPAEAVLLPASIDRPDLAHKFLAVTSQPSLVTWEVEAHQPSRSLLVALGAIELKTEISVGLIQEPAPDEDPGFYEFLVDWYDSDARRLPGLLTGVRFVRTLGGGWSAPSERIFFPRQREEVSFPDDLHVPIASVPDVDGLHTLLEAAGVRPFEWRQLIPEFVLPLLTDPNVLTKTREAALVALRGYYETERTGDPRLLAQIGNVLLPAKDAASTRTDMATANTLYFSSVWIERDNLEQIYGPFGEVEFLDIPPPPDADTRQSNLAFFRWIGVAAHPRLDVRSAELGDSYWIESLDKHPFATKYAKFWTDWRVHVLSPNSACDQLHPASSQQLRSSFGLDRFPELVASADHSRLARLWIELARSWAAYEAALTSTLKCSHGWHNGERTRQIPSLLRYMLQSASWAPCISNGARSLTLPSRAWRLTPDTPPRVVERIAVLDPALEGVAASQMAASVGVVDAARPGPGDLIALLKDIATTAESLPNEDERATYLAARWAMRTLNDALEKGGRLAEAVPLLARLAGAAVFVEQPFVANDPLLAETFEPFFPILDADRDLRRLQDALGLRVLDDEVLTRPVPQRPRPDRHTDVERSIRDASPYLAAVAIDQVPSRRSDIVRGLSRLEITVCEDLILRYELDGETQERKEAVSYIAVRLEGEGTIRRRIGTAHLELNPISAEPHWYAFGPQLAVFLLVPGLGDAFALLLAASKSEREQYLGARRVSLDAVEEARIELSLPPLDEEEELRKVLAVGDAGVNLGNGIEALSADATTSSFEEGGSPVGKGTVIEAIEPLPELPALDHSAISLTDAPVGGASGPEGTTINRNLGLGRAGPIDHERQRRMQRLIGRRGEEAAFEAEKRRVRDLGFDSRHVTWVSLERELAPYDIKSLDDDGQVLYIEVKSTTADDPYEPFEISEAELLFGLKQRTRYCIYRVISTHLATPAISRFRDPIGRLSDNTARIRLVGARFTFLALRDPDADEASDNVSTRQET